MTRCARWLGVLVAAVVAALTASAGALDAAPARAPAVPPAAAADSAGRAVLPVDGPVVRLFAPPATPYGSGHRGVDVAAAPGTPVRAALPGTVSFSGVVARRGWVTVDHGGGLDTTYGVLDPRLVRAGDRVDVGDAIGRLTAGARHLDWGARLNGDYVDPLSLLGRWRPHLVALDGP